MKDKIEAIITKWSHRPIQATKKVMELIEKNKTTIQWIDEMSMPPEIQQMEVLILSKLKEKEE